MNVVYLVYYEIMSDGYTGFDDGPWKELKKIFTTNQKAIDWVKEVSGQDVNEDGFVEFNQQEYPNGIVDSECYYIESHDVE